MLPPKLRDNIYIPNLPKNMDPDHHEGRRKARVKALNKGYSMNSTAVYTDAAPLHQHRGAVATVVISRDPPLTSLTINTNSIQEAQEVAIVWAIIHPITLRSSPTPKRDVEATRLVKLLPRHCAS
ncbi:hypothetical protein HPB49_022903 [Dermacentor silvarum]|uniref:Uncharacterized protein n=1 Tax=Dermacentor silvarum TaxID=543639 RepID=A0ACB8E3V2_DERSI|nr:hypothetical protein HPB49_022903 [Dermacentor silvarum]